MMNRLKNFRLSKSGRCWKTGLLTVILIASIFHPAAGQSLESLQILNVELKNFPTVRFYLEARDSQGAFLTDVNTDNLKVNENGKLLPLDSLELYEPGIQFTLAVNAAPMLANYVAGTRQYDSIKQTLETWVSQFPADTPDDFSFSTNAGMQTVRTSAPQDFISALESYQPDFLSSQSSLISLSQALNLATDPNPNPDMKRAILYVTPLPSTTIQASLPDLASRASDLGVRVFVWLVAPINYDTSAGAESLRQLAETTGGAYFLYSGVEQLPNPETYLSTLRYKYLGTYTSAINQSGIQQISAQITRAGQKITSAGYEFSLNVQSPNPMFLSPPAQIQRSWVEIPTTQELQLTPDLITIPILVEFPDNYFRQIKQSILYVDGVVVDRNTVEPFDEFNWPLEELTVSGDHTLQVQITDSLGLTSKSTQTVIKVLVDAEPKNFFQEFFSNQRLVIFGAVLLSLLVMVFVFILARQPRLHPENVRMRKKLYQDPVTQPVYIPQEDGSVIEKLDFETPTVPRARAAMNAPARLVQLSKEGHPVSQNPILLDGKELTIGSDPQQAMCVLKDPSIEGLHARLFSNEKKEFVLADAESTAGTWVNYAPISTKGIRLEHGDLIQIGRISFRFELSGLQEALQTKKSPLGED